MRRSLVVLVLFLAACRKHNPPTPDSGCITRIFPAPAVVNAGQMDTIRALFQANGLSTDTLLGYGYPTAHLVFTSLVQYNIDSVLDSVQFVTAQLYFNGLSSYAYQYWEFDGGRIRVPGPAQYQILHTNDTAARLPLAYLRSAFLSIAPAEISALTIPYFGPYDFNDSCLSATLSYIPAVYIDANAPSQLLIRGWAITTEDGLFPTVYVDDENGAVQPKPRRCTGCLF